MFDAVIPITDAYNFISDDDVIPEFNENPNTVDQPTCNEPLLSISDNMFDEKLVYSNPTRKQNYNNDSFNIKFSNFASEVYEDINSRKPTLLNHEYINALSNENLTTYVDTNDRSLVISLRGTVPTNVEDIVSDIGIVGGDKSVLLQRVADCKKNH